MRSLSRLALFGLVVGLSFTIHASAADEPAPLLKPVTPAGGAVRVRLPVNGYPRPLNFAAQIPNGKKKTELQPVTVAFDTLINKSYISTKKLESLGYEVGKKKEIVIPELLISTAQLAPKPAKGHDAILRLADVKLTIIESPASEDGSIFSADLALSSSTLYGGSERTREPRLSFADRFLELTVPASMVKWPGTDELELRKVATTADDKLIPAYGPLVSRGQYAFTYAAVNTQESYKLASGKVIPVNVSVASFNNWEPGIVMSIGLARGCNVEMDQAAKGASGTAVNTKTEMIPGKLKEFRIGLMTGDGFKTPKDLVLKDVPVMVDKYMSEGAVTIGQRFIEKHFKDGVYSGAGDGYRLYGRVNPDNLADVATRRKADPNNPDPKGPNPKP